MKRAVVALVDESRCIGCAQCIEACPVDAIIGARGWMHTVVADWCTGCELCLPPCPVDCIALVPARGAWTQDLARAAKRRRARRAKRLALRDAAAPLATQAERRASVARALERSRKARA